MIDNDKIQNHLDGELLSSYVNGDPEQDERKRIEAHLAECDACRGDLAGLRAVVDLLQQLPQYNPPRSFQLGSEHENHRKQPATLPAIRMLPIVRTLSIAAVIAFLVVTGALFVNHDNGNDKTTFTGAALAPQETNSQVGSGTGGNSPTSQSAEDESPSQAKKDTDDEQTSGSSQSLIDRGDAASADNSASFDEPAAAAPPQAAQSAQGVPTVTPSPQTSQGQGAPLTAEPVDTSDDSSGTSWLATSIGLGILAIILIGLWLVLARISKARRDGLT